MAVSYLVRLKPNQLVELFAGSAARQLLRKQSVFEYSLCLSRACLGKKIAFIYIYGKRDRFLTGALRSSISIAKRSGCGLYLLQALV